MKFKKQWQVTMVPISNWCGAKHPAKECELLNGHVCSGQFLQSEQTMNMVKSLRLPQQELKRQIGSKREGQN